MKSKRVLSLSPSCDPDPVAGQPSRRSALLAALPSLDRRGFLTQAALTAALPQLQKAAASEPDGLWKEVRAAFSLDERFIDLASNGMSPATAAALQEQKRVLDELNGSAVLFHRVHGGKEMNRLRARLARHIGASPGEVALMRNTTEAMSTAIFGLPLNPGDEVLTTTHDYPAMVQAWKQREQREGIRLRQVSIPLRPSSVQEVIDRIEKAITPRTRVLMVCHIVFITGQILPMMALGELARKHNLVFMVDGAHGFAHVPVQVDEIQCDYYATSLHKWLSAPHGTGFLYVRQSRIASHWPWYPSDHVDSRSEDITKLEAHGTSTPVWTAVHPALDLYELIGAERKQRRLHELKRYWTDRVVRLPGVTMVTSPEEGDSCGFAVAHVEGFDQLSLARWMRLERQILIGASVRRENPLFQGLNEGDGLSIATQVFNTTDELDRMISVLGEVIRKGSL